MLNVLNARQMYKPLVRRTIICQLLDACAVEARLAAATAEISSPLPR
jgi:hypothetical protein